MTLRPLAFAVLVFMSIFGTAIAQINPPKGPSPEPKTEASPTPPPATDYDIKWGVKIPMRDKVELNATLYFPKTPDGSQPKTPVIFTLTPYISDSYHPRAAYFASHGYVFALVDVRGRGNSGGDFEPFAQEPHDGHDVVEWLAQQPFCDGKVAMWGGSYAGFDQWATAKEMPPHLTTIVPAAAAHPPLDYPSLDNIGEMYDMQWFTFTSGKAGQINLFGDSKLWRTKFLDFYKKHLAFKTLDSFVGNPSVSFQRILKHPTADAYYDAMVPTVDQFKKFTLPILTITGQYDGDELGAMTFYRDHIANSPPEIRAKHFLIIGPWDHAGTRTPTDEVAGVKFGKDAIVDLNDLHRQWYDWTMKNGTKPAFLKNQVAYYLIASGNSGANGEWKYTDSYANLIANPKTFYLETGPNGGNGILQSGFLHETRPKEGQGMIPPGKFVYDPLDTKRGEEIEGVEPNDKTAGIDQKLPLSIGNDGLVYHSNALPQETPLVGCPAVTLWVSIDTPDVDLEADLYEIQPDGTSIGLWSDMRRLRYRESLREAKLAKPGEIVKCEFNPGLFVARKMMKGSRLRLVVTAVNSIFWQKNYCSGGVVADETAKDAHTCHVQVYHDAEHSSSIGLPLR
ncbi:MAG TPA: CocE/NonD family hydrolase [Chthoniobacterales bacterium]|nr:CocE/NonD family hydrolase [Chthoniobacterales bacterium]